VLLANLLLYGPGALLIRELKIRWRKGWLAVFILAIAYVIAEEGLMLNTLFDPTKNTVGRFVGVNWVWTAGMIVVHSLLSIFMPILMAEAVYSEKADQPWVKPGTFYLLLVLFAANVIGTGRLFAPANRPGAVYYVAEAGTIGICLWLAWRLPVRSSTAPAIGPRSALWLYIASLIGMFFTMATGFAAPALPLPGLVKMVLMLAVYFGFLGLLWKNQVFDPGLSPVSKFAVAGGIISFWILAAPLMSILKGNIGPIIFALGMLVFLVSVHKRLRKRPMSAAMAAQ
jgi:hypothetical protein